MLKKIKLLIMLFFNYNAKLQRKFELCKCFCNFISNNFFSVALLPIYLLLCTCKVKSNNLNMQIFWQKKSIYF